ncbi:MAG TPA: DUF2071 domain-containing protein [Candidatus Limnocylindrales bacterium]|jgi:uncharacterized protein|nr:DUF2071 domain-containing protein [Candidatus Limnocylindrales bacterium]
MAQRWERLLFMHWPLPECTLRPLVPAGLTLQTFGGQAWLGVTPFTVSVLRPRAAWIPGLAPFPEVNVRTYVTVDEKPGVFFFSLDAGSVLAVAGARALYSLPYFRARFSVSRDRSGVAYHARRTHRGAPPADLSASYRPAGPAAPSIPGTLAHWLTERYCLYAVTRRGRLRRAEIHHPPWPLQPAEVDIRVNTMTSGLGFHLPAPAPLVHFSERLDVQVWLPERVGASPGLRPLPAEGERPPAEREP